MLKTPIRQLVSTNLRAFTLLETLLTLMLLSFLVSLTWGQVQGVFREVEEKLFLLRFEHFYLDSQRYAASQRQKVELVFSQDFIRTELDQIDLPDSLSYQGPSQLVLDQQGGHSTLAKLSFRGTQKIYRYQFYLGSGRYKKDISSLHSP